MQPEPAITTPAAILCSRQSRHDSPLGLNPEELGLLALQDHVFLRHLNNVTTFISVKSAA
jgi:hypothetical protein